MKGSRRGLEVLVSRRALQNAFKNPSKTFQEGVGIDDALGFPGLENQVQGPGVLQQEMKVLIIECFRGGPEGVTTSLLVGLRTQTQNAAFFERKGPETQALAPREVFKSQKMIAMRFFER